MVGPGPHPEWTVHTAPWAEVMALGPARDEYTSEAFSLHMGFVFSLVHICLLLSCLDTWYLLPKDLEA